MAREQRRLAAIVAADVAGYSRLMGRDEAGTLAALRAHRAELIDPAIAAHGGRIVKTMGDGLLLEFPSAVEATRCAIEIQAAMRRRNAEIAEADRLAFRIGINLGDIIIDGADIHGDGVNVAARLEGEAPAGGIVISGNVHESVNGRLKANFVDLGELVLKNIERKVRAYRVEWGAADWPVSPAATVSPTAQPAAPSIEAPLALPDKPSIAVLPFNNMSGDAEQEYFADGITEDIITALSKFRGLFVIARNSSFAYKGKSPDIRQVGRELGVRYVLEGSVRKSANRVRITGQLVEAQSGSHIWADRIDGPLDDIFDLQDKVTESIVGAMAPRLERAEIERTSRKPTGNLDAYNLCLRGRASMLLFTRDGVNEALTLFQRTIALDPGYATAYGFAAFCYSIMKASGWLTDPVKDSDAANRLARRALELDKDDAVIIGAAGYTLAYVVGDLDAGAHFIEHALALNPNLAVNWSNSGWINNWLGNTELAVEHFARAMRLSPLDPQIGMMHTGLAHVHFQAGRYEESIARAQTFLRERGEHLPVLRIAAAALAMAGRDGEARATAGKLRRIAPDFRIATMGKVLGPYRHQEAVTRYVEGLRRAGLPE